MCRGLGRPSLCSNDDTRLTLTLIKIFLLTIPRRTSFVDHLCYLYLVFFMLSRLFIAALWSPAGKGLTS